MKVNYGIDAPNVARNLFLFSFASALIALFSFRIESAVWFWIVFLYSLLTCATLFATGCWMLYSIKIAKPKLIAKLIENLHLSGSEKLLDIGCGRGLLLCEAAKRLPRGKAHGIDLWLSRDQSGNKPETTLENADREGVKDRVVIHTGNAMQLPFPDATFDAIASSLCLHNIKNKKEREKALLECLRVLKPGGKFAIADIHYGKEYAHLLVEAGVKVHRSKSHYSYCPPITTLEGWKQ